jgi:hypothetical protein
MNLLDLSHLIRPLEWTQFVVGVLSILVTLWSWQDALEYRIWAEDAYPVDGHVETARQHELTERLRLLCQISLIVYAVTGIVLPEQLGPYAHIIVLRKILILGLIVMMGMWSYVTARWRVRMRGSQPVTFVAYLRTLWRKWKR